MYLSIDYWLVQIISLIGRLIMIRFKGLWIISILLPSSSLLKFVFGMSIWVLRLDERRARMRGKIWKHGWLWRTWNFIVYVTLIGCFVVMFNVCISIWRIWWSCVSCFALNSYLWSRNKQSLMNSLHMIFGNLWFFN